MFNRIWTRSRLYRVLFGFEEWFKKRIFGCHSCGQCVLRSTSLVCPQTCPKQMRNGPCGGSMFGKCEVFPDRDCVWTKIHERADTHAMQIFDMSEKIVRIQPAVDWSIAGTLPWVVSWKAKQIAMAASCHRILCPTRSLFLLSPTARRNS